MCIFFRHLLRAEKEKAQYFGELNDLRAGVDHLSNEKVQRPFEIEIASKMKSKRCILALEFN